MLDDRKNMKSLLETLAMSTELNPVLMEHLEAYFEYGHWLDAIAKIVDQSGRASFQVWGCFGAGGARPLVKIEGITKKIKRSFKLSFLPLHQREIW